MGNVLAECQKYGLDQCEVCTQPTPQLHGSPSSGQGQAGRAGRSREGQEQHLLEMSEAEMIQQALRISRLEAEQARRRPAPGSPQGADAAGESSSSRTGPLVADEDASLMAAIAASYASGSGRAGPQSEEERAAAAARKAAMEEENRERARLRQEQEAEYEESLRIDREREAEKALRRKEEEEQRRREAAEEEARKREAERKRAEAEEAERVTKEKIATLVEEARERLLPEPEASEPDRVQVLVRTPDGKRLKRAFRAVNPVGQLYYYTNLEAGEALRAQDYRLVSSMPRVVYEDREATLEAAGLKGQCALLVEVIDDD